MARARFVRPEFFTDEKVGELPYGARLLFEGLWCHSDLRGVFEYSPKQLRVLVFPFDEGLTSVTVTEWLENITALGMVVRFESDGKTWGAVVHWLKHQSVSPKEVETWTRRPCPPGWVDPPAWDGYIKTALASGRVKVDPRTVPEQFQNFTLTPSPSITPSPSTPPTCARDPAATAALRKTVRGYNTAKVTDAIQAEDLGALVAAFGGNKRGDEWARDAAGRTIGVIAAVFDFMVYEKRPIREPSGLRKALAEWDAKPSAWRCEWARHMAEELGFNVSGTP